MCMMKLCHALKTYVFMLKKSFHCIKSSASLFHLVVLSSSSSIHSGCFWSLLSSFFYSLALPPFPSLPGLCREMRMQKPVASHCNLWLLPCVCSWLYFSAGLFINIFICNSHINYLVTCSSKVIYSISITLSMAHSSVHVTGQVSSKAEPSTSTKDCYRGGIRFTGLWSLFLKKSCLVIAMELLFLLLLKFLFLNLVRLKSATKLCL